MQTDETAYTIAEKKGYQKVCEELQPSESRQQPVVRSDSSQHKIAVSFIFSMDIMCKVMTSLCYMLRRGFKALELLYLDGSMKHTTKLQW